MVEANLLHPKLRESIEDSPALDGADAEGQIVVRLAHRLKIPHPPIESVDTTVQTAKNHFSDTRICLSVNSNLTLSRKEIEIHAVSSQLASIPTEKKNPCAVHVPVVPTA